MKQIFDWLREQMRKEIVCTHAKPIKAEHTRITAYENAIKLLDEAEAKWEAEVCEWTHKEHHANCFCGHNLVYEEYDFVLSWKFCPYCGKRIKILEVEQCD